MSLRTYVENQNCKECGADYEAKYIVVVDAHDLSGGLCYTCREKRYQEQAAQEEAARLAVVARKRRDWRERCGIPQFYVNRDFSTFEIDKQPTAYKRAVTYADQFPIGRAAGYKSLVLYSDNVWGVGKTHLACSIIHRILDRWNGEEITMPCWFTTEPDIFSSIEATFNYTMEERNLRETKDDITNRLGRVSLLVIDDIGKEQRADPRFVQRTLFDIIDARYRRMLPVVLTTNLGPAGLEQYLGGAGKNEATFERIVEMTDGKFTRLTGKSYRRKQ